MLSASLVIMDALICHVIAATCRVDARIEQPKADLNRLTAKRSKFCFGNRKKSLRKKPLFS